MELKYRSSRIGTRCKENQDHILIHEDNGFSVHGVFDGIQSRPGSGEFTKQLVKLIKHELRSGCAYITPTSICDLIDECRSLLARRYPAAGCSFILIANVTGLPYRFFIWAGDCRLGSWRSDNPVWITCPDSKRGILTNRLLAKRTCRPQIGTIDKKRRYFILASDGHWKSNNDDDATYIVVAGSNK